MAGSPILSPPASAAAKPKPAFWLAPKGRLLCFFGFPFWGWFPGPSRGGASPGVRTPRPRKSLCLLPDLLQGHTAHHQAHFLHRGFLWLNDAHDPAFVHMREPLRYGNGKAAYPLYDGRFNQAGVRLQPMDLPDQMAAHFFLILWQISPYMRRNEVMEAIIYAGKAMELLEQCQFFL